MLVFRAGFHKMLGRRANREDPDKTASSEAVLIWVCAVCLDCFGSQLVFEILVHLSYFCTFYEHNKKSMKYQKERLI